MCLSAALGVTVAVLAACTSTTAPERVLIPISQLEVPDSMGQNAVLPVDVTFGDSGCGNFSAVSFSRSANQVTIAAWGELSDGRRTCLASIRSAPVHIDVPGPWSEGSVTVIAEEPGTTPPIVHEVRVR